MSNAASLGLRALRGVEACGKRKRLTSAHTILPLGCTAIFFISSSSGALSRCANRVICLCSRCQGRKLSYYSQSWKKRLTRSRGKKNLHVKAGRLPCLVSSRHSIVGKRLPDQSLRLGSLAFSNVIRLAIIRHIINFIIYIYIYIYILL